MIKAVFSWISTLWICKVFLLSLPYKFSKHPDTEHIFGTIGQWMSASIAEPLGKLFSDFGPYFIGTAELLTCLVLLTPALLYAYSRLGRLGKSGNTRAISHETIENAPRGMRSRWHAIGGLMAAALMSGAVFFHLFTPLGIEVLHQGKSDGGSLFYSAVSILVLGLLMFVLNISSQRH